MVVHVVRKRLEMHSSLKPEGKRWL